MGVNYAISHMNVLRRGIASPGGIQAAVAALSFKLYTMVFNCANSEFHAAVSQLNEANVQLNPATQTAIEDALEQLQEKRTKAIGQRAFRDD